MISLFRYFPSHIVRFGVLFALTGFFPHASLLSQTASRVVWSDISESSIANRSDREIVPQQYRAFRISKDALLSLLYQAPMERTGDGLLLTLPFPDGTSPQFRVHESPMMAPELMMKYPEMRTYVAQGVDDPRMNGRLDWTPFGFHAIVFSPRGTVYIDPYNRYTVHEYISYFKRDLLLTEDRIMHEVGPVDADSETAKEIRRIVESGATRAIGEELRTYRLALATTGEYTQFHGGTVQLGMAAVVTAMNRVNGIYEREVAIRMVLIANNDTLIYTNAATDPYSNNNGGTMLGQNQSNIDNVIGNANYDIGHVFSTGGGGIAGLGVPCRTGQKARGVTGLPSPIGDPFYVDYVAHEMGHQFGGNHTFNGSAGSCAGGNRNPSTAYEPGSGSTIMAYAGICGSQNIQTFSDDYFHGISIDEIVAYTTLGSGNSCPVTTLTGNNPPTVNAGSSFIIPLNTPFVLTGSANDPNGDSLTYCWEEFDLGPAGHPNTPSGNAPIFRSFDPVTSPSRTFPRLSNILNNTQTIGEILPSYTRTMNFRLTARDNRAGGGGVNKASTTVVVAPGVGPFAVTHPNAAIAWITNTTDSITWDVANTDLAPVNCAFVNILLSTDGGQTFPLVLAANTPNDGRETVTVPSNFSSTARVKVEAAGNIFFDISNTNFLITPLTAPSLASPPNNAVNQPTSLPMVWNRVPLASTYHVMVSLHVGFLFNNVVNDSTLTDTTRLVAGLDLGRTYYWRVRAKNNDGQSLWSPTWSFATIAPVAQVTLVSPANQATIDADTALLKWNRQSVIERYWVEYSTDSSFAGSLIDSTITDTTTTLRGLQNNTTYYWRVRGYNSMGYGPFSTVRRFSVVITSVAMLPELPDQFLLAQNYPNPFNPATSIRFAIPVATDVRLEVFNALGQRVALLVDGDQKAGFYDVTFEGGNLSSGMYFYRLRAGEYVSTKKLLLLK